MKRAKFIRIEDNLWKAAKVEAAKLGITLENWLSQAINDEILMCQKNKKREEPNG